VKNIVMNAGKLNSQRVKEVISLHVTAKKRKGILIVALEGELDHHTAGVVRDFIDKRLEDPTIRNMAMDVTGLTFMDSSGIGMLIGRYKIISKRGGKLGVTHTSSHIDRIFRISGLYKIIRAYNGLEEALNDMGVN